MTESPANDPALEPEFYRMYREFFDMAERRRRWSLRDDIPWDLCNRNLPPAIADVVESFCVVELYLPDYVGKALPMVRASRGRAWFLANWGYEESKHSMALGDWLVRSGHRTEEYLSDLETKVFEREWDLPKDNPIGMVTYAMVQELATGLNYRNLRRAVELHGGDAALSKLLMLVSVDEQAHHSFYKDCTKLLLRHYPEKTLEQLRRVMNNFMMPAVHELADSSQRVAAIKNLGVFSEDMYYRDVYMPLLNALGLTRAQMRNRTATRKSAGVAS